MDQLRVLNEKIIQGETLSDQQERLRSELQIRRRELQVQLNDLNNIIINRGSLTHTQTVLKKELMNDIENIEGEGILLIFLL